MRSRWVSPAASVSGASTSRTAAELTNTLVEAKQLGRLSRKLEQLARFDAVVLGELGYVPFGSSA